MEIRLNASGTNPLATKVVYCDEPGFEVASVIVTGKTDAVLLDAQWTLSNAHRLIAEILETGKDLKTIYLTHAHPDHFGSAADLARVWELPVGVIVDRSLPFCSFSFGNECFDENCV